LGAAVIDKKKSKSIFEMQITTALFLSPQSRAKGEIEALKYTTLAFHRES
jgi:hypothetical protein